MDDKAYPEVWTIKSRIADDIKTKIQVDAKDIIKYIDKLVDISINIDLVNEANQYRDILSYLSSQPGYKKDASLLDNIKRMEENNEKRNGEVRQLNIKLKLSNETSDNYWKLCGQQIDLVFNRDQTILDQEARIAELTASLLAATGKPQDPRAYDELLKDRDHHKQLILDIYNYLAVIDGYNKEVDPLENIKTMLTSKDNERCYLRADNSIKEFNIKQFERTVDALKAENKQLKTQISRLNQTIESLKDNNENLAKDNLDLYKIINSLWDILDSPSVGGQQKESIVNRVRILKASYDSAIKDLAEIRNICNPHIGDSDAKKDTNTVHLVQYVCHQLQRDNLAFCRGGQHYCCNELFALKQILIHNNIQISAKEAIEKLLAMKEVFFPNGKSTK